MKSIRIKLIKMFLTCIGAHSLLVLSNFVFLQLFERDPTRRLGIVGNIRLHPFFKVINWQALERREVDPPFKPKVVCPSHKCYLRLYYEEILIMCCVSIMSIICDDCFTEMCLLSFTESTE